MESPFRSDRVAIQAKISLLEDEREDLRAKAKRIEKEIRALSEELGNTRARRAAGWALLAFAIVPVGAAFLAFRPCCVYPKDRAALLGAQAIEQAAELDATDGTSCPTLASLVEHKKLDPKKTHDPWGNAYRIDHTSDDSFIAWSNGRDGRAFTADDISSRFQASDLANLP